MHNQIDPTSDRLFRHTADEQLFTVLQRLPETTLAYCEPGNDWSIGMIVLHLVEAATAYATRLEAVPYTDLPVHAVTTHAELAIVVAACATVDARLYVAAAAPAGVVVRQDNRALTRARATVLAQAIHHATEHRAQIAGALVANGITTLSLDDLDACPFGDAEGLGA